MGIKEVIGGDSDKGSPEAIYEPVPRATVVEIGDVRMTRVRPQPPKKTGIVERLG